MIVRAGLPAPNACDVRQGRQGTPHRPYRPPVTCEATSSADALPLSEQRIGSVISASRRLIRRRAT